MKVIKNTDTIQINCPNCKSILEIDKFDVSFIPHFGHGTKIYVPCMVCETDIRVGNAIPHRWLVWLEKEYGDKDDDVHG